MGELGNKMIDGLRDFVSEMDAETDAKLNAYILLDRSGSMSTRWDEALSSINAYVAGLAKGSAVVTLATFDSHDGMKFDVVRDSVPAGEWKSVTDADATPRGMTPLFDAIGRVASLAETASTSKTVVVVMTDGVENASREHTKVTAKAAVDRCKAKGWEVVFLGADFDAFGEGAKVGVDSGKVLNMSAGAYVQSMSDLGVKSMAYARGAGPILFSDKDRKAAGAGKQLK